MRVVCLLTAWHTPIDREGSVDMQLTLEKRWTWFIDFLINQGSSRSRARAKFVWLKAASRNQQQQAFTKLLRDAKLHPAHGDIESHLLQWSSEFFQTCLFSQIAPKSRAASGFLHPQHSHRTSQWPRATKVSRRTTF